MGRAKENGLNQQAERAAWKKEPASKKVVSIRDRKKGGKIKGSQGGVDEKYTKSGMPKHTSFIGKTEKRPGLEDHRSNKEGHFPREGVCGLTLKVA